MPFPTQSRLINNQWLRMFWDCLNDFECIDMLIEWCLLPCNLPGGQKMLVSLDHAHVVCDVDSFREIETGPVRAFQKRTLANIFTDLRLPMPDEVQKHSVHIRNFIASYRKPSKIVDCLFWNKDSACWPSLNDNDLNEILNYFCYEIDELGDVGKTRLRSLPIFVSLTDPVQTFSLESVDKCLVVKSEILTIYDGLQSLCISTNTLLIRHNAYHEKLYPALKCIICYNEGSTVHRHPLLKLYTNFILPNYSKFPNFETQMRHLEFVRNKLLTYKDILCILRSLKFIKDPKSSELKLAGDFYSPHKALFLTFCKADLPPEPFCRPEWKKLMELGGMKTVANKELFIQFAKQIQQSGKTDSSVAQAKVLIQNVFQLDNLEEESGFLDEISKIDFIPSYTVSTDHSFVCAQYAKDQLISFRESVPYKFESLVWTMQKLLPDYATKCSEIVLRKMHVQIKPNTDSVISHIHQVCEALQKQSNCNATAKGIIETFYKFLSNAAVTKQEIEIRLSQTPIIPILEHNIFAEAKYVVLNLKSEKEIKPYILKASVYFGKYFELFKALGAADEVSIIHYCRTLKLIKQKIRDSTMIPDELEIVKRAIQGIVVCLSSRQGDKLLKQKDTTLILYLLNEDKKLKPSQTLVIADKSGIRSRLTSQNKIEFICKWTKLGITQTNFDPNEVIMRLPPTMRPQLLSEVVMEDLINLSPPVHSTVVNDFKDFINGELFKYIVNRLVKTFQQIHSIQISKEEFDNIFSNLKSLEVHALKSIETVLIHEGQRLNGSESQQQMFYNRKQHILSKKRSRYSFKCF